jgi:hypothetical protein
VAVCPKSIFPEGELSLLFSAALSVSLEICKTLKELLDLGASPRDRVGVRGIEERELTVWQIFCVFCVENVARGSKSEYSHLLQEAAISPRGGRRL